MVLRSGDCSALLFDADLPYPLLAKLRRVARAGDRLIAVRLRPTRRAATIRRRLKVAGLVAHIIDARAVLDEGDALDVTEANDPVRLRRVAARLCRAGFRIAAVFHRASHDPEPPAEMPTTLVAGNRIEIELDNAEARSWLFDELARSRESVSLQVYMVTDDEVGRLIEAALAAAGSRGVRVRVLVNSLRAQHGSFGAENPLLSRLAACPGVELRVSRPLTGLPSVADVKLRDHRKIVVVNGRVALVGGRNLAQEYYTGFAEAQLTTATTWRQVPWLDAGARIEGPAVGAIAESFLESWTDAGGAPFAIAQPEPCGSAAARVVVHRGLRDAHTLEAYLDLVERAQSHIYALNGFPLLLELQHALVRAVRRGVRVRVLVGHVAPIYSGTPFGGPWIHARSIATEMVHSRLDPIVDAGGEVYLFARCGEPGWDAALGVVYPYVHGKVMSADGLRCAVGSANMDVTSSYWESELMVVVEDAFIARRLEGTLDELFAASTLVSRDDPTWRERAKRRSWMRRWPGVLSA